MYTDTIIVLLTILLLLRGAARGFLQSIIGPLAFAIIAIIALCYYNAKQNIFVTLLILGLGQMIVFWILKLFIGPGKVVPSILSRFLGAMITLAWGLVLVLPLIYIMTYLPVNIHPYAKNTVADIKSSKTFWVVNAVKSKYEPPKKEPSKATVNEKPEMITLQSLAQEDKMMALRDDPAIRKAIEEKNYAALISNPKFAAIMKDPDLVKKIMALYSSGQLQKGLQQNLIDGPILEE